MEVFRAVMLTGSIADAAKLLHLSQSAISKMLSHTQQRTRLKLFERVKGRLVATSEAQRLYAEIERLWHSVEKVHTLSRELADPDKGNLYIAASPSLGMTVVPHSVADTVKERPDLRVKVILPLTHALLDAVADKTVDIGITTFEVNHPSIRVHARFECPLVCMMAPSHPLAGKDAIHPHDLIGHRLISVPLQELYGIDEARVYGEALPALNSALGFDRQPVQPRQRRNRGGRCHRHFRPSDPATGGAPVRHPRTHPHRRHPQQLQTALAAGAAVPGAAAPAA